MTRNKYILYLALVVMVILALALASQIRQVQKQWRSTVRIIPGESKLREEVAQTQFDQESATTSGRPEALIKFRAGVSEATISQITSRFGYQVRDEIEAVPGLVAIDDRSNREATAIAASYRALPEVEYAEPNHEISLDEAEVDEKQVAVNDPAAVDQWWLSKINVREAWATTKGGDEIVIAILDSGVEYTHPDLVSRIWIRPENIKPYQDRDLGTIDDVHGYNVVMNDREPIDDNGHGTNLAGIIGAECENNLGACGVIGRTKIMPLKFLNAGGFGTVLGALQGINYAVDRKQAGVNLRIITVSWDLDQPSRALEDLIRKAGEVGILFVVSSGNSNNNNDLSRRYPASYNLGNVLSVAATDRNDALVSFSNYGANSVHIGAPGKDILTTALGNEYAQRSSTSMATAVVAGVAALTLSARPNLSVDQLRATLLKSVDALPGLRGKVSTSGRINAARAVANK